MGFLDLFKATENKQLKSKVTAVENQNEDLQRQLSEYKETTANLQQQLFELQQAFNKLERSVPKEKRDFDELQEKKSALKQSVSDMETEKSRIEHQLQELSSACHSASSDLEKQQQELSRLIPKLQKLKSLHDRYKRAVTGYERSDGEELTDVFPENELMPFIEVDLNCLNIRELRKKYKQYQAEIQKVFEKYVIRYNTKANAAIYKLMVIAMEAELQNIMSVLSYGQLDKAVSGVKSIMQRYYEVAVEGNQSIAPTMKKFIAEIEFLFIESVKTEYEYYVKKEQQREEQRAIREQMKQEAEEQKALEAEKKKVEREEAKYNSEIGQLTEKLQEVTDGDKIKQLEERIAQLQAQMEEVRRRKADIINLQNGKAGYVYIISNLGSFGENIFKIGMTRRQDPIERIKELSNASVPFGFDVHSFIFSQDAVKLENILHKKLNNRRVNKVNLRKEFFNVSIDELEQLVMQHDPTAEFKRTMVAEQYYQSINHDTLPEIQYDDIE